MNSRSSIISKGKGSIHEIDNYSDVDGSRLVSGSKRPYPSDYGSNRGVNASPVSLTTCIDTGAFGSDDSEGSDDSSSDEDSIASRNVDRRGTPSHYIRIFLEKFDNLTVEQISDPINKWECPICYAGRSDVRKFQLQALISHLKTFLSKRIKIHRRLGIRLEEALKAKEITVGDRPIFYRMWNGFEARTNYEIVWPPMVIVTNTRMDRKDASNQWLGMGNAELLSYFEEYPVIKARQSYGPEGHRGVSVLIFDGNLNGFYAAEGLHYRFVRTRLDRRVWESRRCVYVRGLRQLHGYLATKEDMIDFNKHSQGSNVVKFEVKSYKEMILKRTGRVGSASVTHG